MHASSSAIILVALAAALAPAATGAGPEAPPAALCEPRRALPEQLRARVATSRGGVVVTRNDAASRAGARMLETGGNAVDAAVAAAFALGVAEPGSCGLGGQTYALVRLADGSAFAIDGSARSPLRASPEELDRLREGLRLTSQGSYLSGYASVATPGTPAALDLLRRRWGTRSLAEVIAPAIEIAEFGSSWSAALRSSLEHYAGKVRPSEYLSRLFLTAGLDAWPLGHRYCNPDLACLLRRLSVTGIEGFYKGQVAAEIEQDMIANGGWLRRSDLALLEATVREPLRGRYRGLEVLSFPYPGGGAAVVEALGILDRFDPGALRGDAVDRIHLLVEASRLALADSFPDRRPPRLPDDRAVDAGHLAARAARIRLDRALTPGEVSAEELSTLEVGGTTQVSVVDRLGNAVSLSQTLGAAFGAGTATEGLGFTHNNLLESFDFSDPRKWQYLMPLRPPRTTMAPTILVGNGVPLLVLGSSGSARITSAIVSVVVGVVDRGLPLCEAVSAPRALWGGNADPCLYLELVEPITVEVAETLAARGFARQKRLAFPADDYALTDFGGVNALYVDPADGTMVGVGDPRRQGAARAVDEGADAAVRLEPPPCWRALYALPSHLPARPAAATADPGR
jgi:gamma-glutamyltranspeptidase/glutathione hydrolase